MVGKLPAQGIPAPSPGMRTGRDELDVARWRRPERTYKSFASSIAVVVACDGGTVPHVAEKPFTVLA
jgi:hypothetical protein